MRKEQSQGWSPGAPTQGVGPAQLTLGTREWALGAVQLRARPWSLCAGSAVHGGLGCPCSVCSLIQGTSSTGARKTDAESHARAHCPTSQVTFGHDLMHGHGEEEDGVAVVGPRASTEVLLHSLHDREELVCQHTNIVEDDLQEGTGTDTSEHPRWGPSTHTGHGQDRYGLSRAHERGTWNLEELRKRGAMGSQQSPAMGMGHQV